MTSLTLRLTSKCITDPVQRFKLKQLHKLYQSYKLTETKLKILDIGTGPVIAHAISAAPYASEIVLSEYTEACALCMGINNSVSLHKS